jgi:enoyl-CoA hydratase/carnithine racemase
MTFTVAPDVLARGGVEVDLRGSTLLITLSRPTSRNAMTPAMWTALESIGDALTDEVRVVVVRGAGAGFSAGLDRAMLTPEGPEGEESFVTVLQGNDADVIETIGGYQRGYTWLRRPDIVSIAAVHGHCIGGGFQLALACDLRIAADDASFCMKEPALGLVPDLTGTKPLVEAVGYARALEIVATARNVGAAEALALGLVQQVVSVDELEDAALALAASVSQHSHAAVTGSKALLQQANDTGLDQQIVDERTVQVGRLRELAAFFGLA